MLEYPRWKYILILVVLLLGLVLALPNIFGQDLALQIARKDHDPMKAGALPGIEQFLNDEHLAHTSAYLDGDRVMVRFADNADQLKARDAVNTKFADQYITALSIASREPAVLRDVGMRPMKLGLDLQGGLYLLYQVDTQSDKLTHSHCEGWEETYLLVYPLLEATSGKHKFSYSPYTVLLMSGALHWS